MSELAAPFVVEATFQLPGLGVLVLPAAPEPSWLAAYALHTPLTIKLPLAMQSIQSAIGTVEEISKDDQLRRALLLDLGPNASLPIGTCLEASEFYSELR